MQRSRLFHLLTPDEWQSARATGSVRPRSLTVEGFVHLSFADQVLGSADRHFAEAPALSALEIDPAALDATVRLEDSYGSGTEFPHLYAPLPCAAVLAVHALRRAVDGRWEFTDAATAPASRDH